MVSIFNRPASASSTTAATAPDVSGAAPPHLRGLLAVNPHLAGHLAADPGLRAFLDANKSSLVQWEKPPATVASDKLTWSTWCHTTNIVPAHVRDEEYIVVVARGSSYDNKGTVKLPLQGGGEATSDGRIVFVGKTKDYLHTQQKADEGGHYPGAISVDIELPVAGRAGEQVALSYARVKPDAQGRLHRSQSGWPDSFRGVAGGYSGRETTVQVRGGKNQAADAPDGCSTRSTARVL